MPLRLVALEQAAHPQPQRAVDLLESFAHVLVHRRLGNAETCGRGAHGALLFQQIGRQLADPSLDVVLHETTPRARRRNAAQLWNMYMSLRPAICAAGEGGRRPPPGKKSAEGCPSADGCGMDALLYLPASLLYLA